MVTPPTLQGLDLEAQRPASLPLGASFLIANPRLKILMIREQEVGRSEGPQMAHLNGGTRSAPPSVSLGLEVDLEAQPGVSHGEGAI